MQLASANRLSTKVVPSLLSAKVTSINRRLKLLSISVERAFWWRYFQALQPRSKGIIRHLATIATLVRIQGRCFEQSTPAQIPSETQGLTLLFCTRRLPNGGFTNEKKAPPSNHMKSENEGVTLFPAGRKKPDAQAIWLSVWLLMQHSPSLKKNSRHNRE